jgi:polar amino acid transport system substrate-binding protein
MFMRQVMVFAATLGVGIAGPGSAAKAEDIRIMISGALAASYTELIPEFERRTGHKLVTTLASSQGGSGDSIPERLKRNEIADVLVMGRESLDNLLKDGKAVTGSQVDIVRSGMGLAVRAGLPKPDISTLEALKKTLLDAKSVAYSASVSGTYLSAEVFPKLGIAEQMLPKSKRIVGERVGAVLLRGEADLGMQQISELTPFGDKLQYVGPLPEGAQRITLFAAAVSANSPNPAIAKQLIDFLASRDAHAAIRKFNLEPVSATRDEQALAEAFAPSGSLRAIINLGNPVLAKRSSEQAAPTGVSVDLANELARRLGVPIEYVVVTSAGKAVETLRAGNGDLGFFAIDPMRSDGITFSAPYINIDGAYLVREGSPMTSRADVDKAGVRIAVGLNSAYDLFLTREIKAATLVRVPTSPEVVPAFTSQNLEVAAGVKQQLEADQLKNPGLRLLPGAFMTIHQAMGLPSGRKPDAHAYLAKFVEEAKASGFVLAALRRHAVPGAAVAPPGPAK